MAIFYSFIHSLFNVCLLCFNQVPSTMIAGMETFSLSCIDCYIFTWIIGTTYSSAAWCLFRSEQSMNVWMCFCQCSNSWSSWWIWSHPAGSTQKLSISEACPSYYIHMKEDSGTGTQRSYHWSEKVDQERLLKAFYLLLTWIICCLKMQLFPKPRLFR